MVFSDNTLVGVERQDDGNWLLTSLEAFSTNETLIITFNDDRTIVIDVTDPAWEPVYFSFPNSATTGITGHTKDNVVGSKTVTVILYDAVTGKELDRATNTNVNGNFYLELRSDNSKYWFEITEVGGGHVQFREKGLLNNYNAYTYTSKLDQYSVTFERTRTGSGTVTIKVNCYPTLITNSTNSEYCYVRRVTKMAATNDTQTRSLNIVVDRVGNNDTTVTYSNLLFPDRNGDGNGHGDVEADRDIAITGTAPGYKNATKTESGTTYIVTVNPITYTIVFNGNGNTSGSMSNQVFEYDVAQNLQSNGYSRAYQVSFDSSGGDAVAARTATATFNGWATSKTGAVKYTNGQSVEKLTTTDGKQVELFANWTLGSLTLPSTTKAGYTLEGWTDGTKTYAAGSSYTPTANVTLTAQWKAKTYKVTLDAQNGTGESDGTTAYWYMYNTTKDVNGETVYYWTDAACTQPLSGYTVYYWTNAACTSPLHNYTITKPTKKGHTFGGYYTAVNGGGTQYVDDKGMCVNNLYAAVADNSTLYAKWTAKTFTVNYHSNGGSGSMDSHTVVYGNTIQIKDNAFTAPSGKRFAGWAVSSTGTAGEHGWSKEDKTGWSGTWSYDNGEYGIANDTLNLYAVWEDDDRTVTWKNWNGDELEKDTVTYNGTATYNGTTPTLESAAGYSYSFTGWDKGTNGTVSNVTTDTTVTAQFSKTPISYIASFDYNGGDEGVATKNFTVESALTLPKLTKTGYTGKWIVTEVEGNWTNGAEFASEGSVAAGKYGNVTFTAQWTPITYKIQFAGGEGGQGSMAEITATYDKDVTLPENKFQRIIKVTYDVNGGKNLDPSDTVVSLEATLKNWVYNSTEYKDQASVKNLASTQDAVVQMTAQWNLKSTTTPTVEKDGYTFGGWKLKDAATDLYEADETITPARDITLVAQWNPISYTITYDSNGGSAVEPTSYNIEQAVTLASAPTREGYKFDGWKLQTAGGNWIAGDYTADQIIGTGKYGNVTLVAQWKDQYRYVLNYNANTTDTVGNMPTNVDSGWVDATKYTADLSATPTRANYDFMGWATSEDATAADVLSNCELQGIAHDTASATLYAVWQRQTGDLKLTFNGGETAPAIVTVSGQGKTITLVLTKAETVIKGLPTGEYSVAVESGNASYVASVRTNPNPKIENNQTAEVEITTGSKGLNWFTAFYWVKNKFGMQN